MVRREIVRVDGNGTQMRYEVFGDEDVVAAIGRLPLAALMHAECVRVRPRGMQALPRVHELRRAVDECFEKAGAQWILGRHVEVPTDERALGMRQLLERPRR